ncbi:MAG: 30S ribosome-binding factor RbfA [Coxiella-like endosymbiont]
MTTTQRQQRVADLIHHQLAVLLKKEVHDPRLVRISITAVSISPDLKQAKIFYTFLENKNRKATQKALDKAIGYLRCLLAEATKLRYVPQLQFAYDESLERAERISSLINCAFKNENDS